jgi:GT2 family glycosyltransferase
MTESCLTFSVVIPTYKRHDDLFRCLDALSHHFDIEKCQSYKFDVEVIVSDDACEIKLRDVLKDRYPWCTYVEGPNRGPAANRNHGASHASGDWLAFIDDECISDSGWLGGFHCHALQQNIDVIEGKTVVPNKISSPFYHGVENIYGACYWSCNLAIRRSTFTRIGGFDEDFLEAGGEDMELAWRFSKNKLQCVFEWNALVLHPQRRYTLHSFLKRVPLLRWSVLYHLKTDEKWSDNQVGYTWTTRSQLAPIVKVAAMLKRHLEEVLAYITHRITNATSESFNSRIQSIKSAARGFRNFENYRTRILFRAIAR